MHAFLFWNAPLKLIVATTSAFTDRRSYSVLMIPVQQQAGTGNCRSCWTICGSFLSTGRYLRINGAEIRNCGDHQLLILSLPFSTYHQFPKRLKLSFYTADAHFKRLRKTILSCACYCVKLSLECLQRSVCECMCRVQLLVCQTINVALT